MKKINEKEVELFVKSNCNSSYFIKHIFYYLREHMELLEKEDYKHLYEEALTFLLQEAKWENNEKNREWLEYLCDLHNKRAKENDELCNRMRVKEFLEHRKKHWK